MYLKGYDIEFDNGQTEYLPKLDYAGDKPWTNSHWHNIVESLREIDHTHFPLLIKDLDNDHQFSIQDMTELEKWLNVTFKIF